MLQNLHVKNLALIDEVEITFDEHLNILTGETVQEICLDRFYKNVHWEKNIKRYDPTGSKRSSH